MMTSTNNWIKQEKQKQKEKQLSQWQRLINGIVRPPRARYHQLQLGGNCYQSQNRLYNKKDYQLDHEGKCIQLTVYKALTKGNYLILYMHGNSSCKLEALGLIQYLPDGVSLATFDFMGCGKNLQIETVSLGFREAQQAATVAEFLRGKGFFVILWGRSMGAAASLLYGKAQFIVADSSFKSFKSLCKQVAKENSKVPNVIINCFFPCVFTKLRHDVQQRAQYDIDDLDIKDSIQKLDPNTVIVFMSGKEDTFINPRNSIKLHNICPCKTKYLKLFKGTHNSKRPPQVMREVMCLISDYIQSKD